MNFFILSPSSLPVLICSGVSFGFVGSIFGASVSLGFAVVSDDKCFSNAAAVSRFLARAASSVLGSTFSELLMSLSNAVFASAFSFWSLCLSVSSVGFSVFCSFFGSSLSHVFSVFFPEATFSTPVENSFKVRFVAKFGARS